MERPFRAYQGGEPYVFVSYSHDDASTVFEDLNWLNASGINIWYDEGIAAGSVWRDALAARVADCSACLFFVSPRSLASRTCLEEVSYATAKGNEVLLVYLEEANLPPGMEMTLGYRQAIMREQYTEADYRGALLAGLESALSGKTAHPHPVEQRPAEPRLPDRRSERREEQRSLAVLPFANLSADPDNVYLADGIAEDLLMSLAKIDGLRVQSRSSSFAFRDSTDTVQQIGRQLRVGTVLEGSVRRAGERVRITTQLVDTATGDQLWSERYDRTIDDLFDVQDDIAAAVTREVVAQFDLEEPESTAVDFGTRDIQAYNAYLQGRFEFHKATPEALLSSLDRMDEAIEADPDFLDAHIGKVSTLQALEMFHGEDRKSDIEATRRELERLDPSQEKVAWRQLMATDGLPWDFRAEEALFRDIICNPDHPAREQVNATRWAAGGFDVQPPGHVGISGMAHYGLLLAEAGLYETGIAYLRSVEGQDSAAVGASLIALGRFDEARECFMETNRTGPSIITNRLAEYGLLLRCGEEGAAERARADFRVHMNDDLEHVARVIHAQETGDRTTLASLIPGVYNLALPLFFKALCIANHDPRAALPVFEEALDRGEVLLRNLLIWGPCFMPEARWDDLTIEDRYDELLVRLGLTPDWYAELATKAKALEPFTGIDVLDP